MSKKNRGGAKGRAAAPISSVTLSGDMGATGQANRHGLIREEAPTIDPDTLQAHNPNGVYRMRRVDMIEVWHKNGTITTAQYNAAVRLRTVWEATGQTPGWPDNDRVQSSAKPDASIMIHLGRIDSLTRITRHIPAADWPILDRCVLGGGAISALGYRGTRYQAGLVALADALERLSVALEK